MNIEGLIMRYSEIANMGNKRSVKKIEFSFKKTEERKRVLYKL
jgi:hypothetical protein